MRPPLTSSATLLLVAALAALLPSPAGAHKGDAVALAVIVSHKSGVKNLSLRELERVFTSEPVHAPDGRRFIPINHPPKTTDRVAFDRIVLRLEPHEVGKFWIDRRVRGEPGPPRTVESLSTLLRLVARLPGAIGYARSTDVKGDVRPIKIDGKLPSEERYPIQYHP